MAAGVIDSWALTVCCMWGHGVQHDHYIMDGDVRAHVTRNLNTLDELRKRLQQLRPRFDELD